MQDRIYPGEIWLDTTGKPIHAHGFSVFYSEPDGCYYWYGDKPILRWRDSWSPEEL